MKECMDKDQICEVYIDQENKLFGINDFNSKYTLPFGEMVDVKPSDYKTTIRLVFNEKIIYFIPFTAFDLFSGPKELMKTLKGVISRPQ
jgi:hypothetical protein